MAANKKYSSLLAILWLTMILMVVAVVYYLLHKQLMDWTTEFWALVISIFSAAFSAINVLAFYKLTIAIEEQNDERQKEALRYDALKYQLERQQEIFNKVEALAERLMSTALIDELNEDKALDECNKTLRQLDNQLLILSTLHDCTQLFPTVDQTCLDDLLEIRKAWENKKNERVEKLFDPDEKDFQKNRIRNFRLFWSRNYYKCYAFFTLILAQMRYDMQSTLSQSIGQEPPQCPDFLTEKSTVIAFKQVPDELKNMLKGKGPYSLNELDTDMVFNYDYSKIESKKKTTKLRKKKSDK